MEKAARQMMRYLIFAADRGYDPCGGWHDYCGSMEDLEAAKGFAKAKAGSRGWGHVVDRNRHVIIWQYPRGDKNALHGELGGDP